MKATFLISLIVFFNLSIFAQDTDTASEGITITVTVPVKSADGTVLAGLHTETTFMKAAAVLNAESEIAEGTATLVFENVVPGTYGIVLFHDKNGNKNMDFEPNGMPKEMYGVSNNVMSYGPPQWSDAQFEVTDEDIEMEIRL